MPRKAERSTRARWSYWKAGLIGFVCLVCVVTVSYCTAPTHNTEVDHFDAIVVLGTPASMDGRLTKAGRWLVDEAVREYRAGRAERVIISGAAVANEYCEADVLAKYARESGLPATAILEDRKAQNTLQNVQNSAAIMREHGWRSAEVIGLKEHLPRSAVLLQTIPILWRTRAAATPGRHWMNLARHTVEEAIGTAVLRIFGLRSVPLLHAVKRAFGVVFHKRP